MILYRAVSEPDDREAYGQVRFIEDAVKAIRAAYWPAVRGDRRVRVVVEMRAEPEKEI